MTDLLWAPHAYVCRTPHHVVLLDLRRDKYFALDEGQAQAIGTLFPQLGSNDSTANLTRDAANTLVADLVREGLLTKDPTVGRPLARLDMQRPTRALADEYLHTEIPIRAHHVLRFLASYVWCLLAKKHLTIESLIGKIQQRNRCSIGRSSSDQARQLSTVFERLRPWFYVGKDACLFDSLMLIHFLSSYRITATWIFGVKTAPFAAHCWVQQGDVVLNDIPDTVCRYTPIMTV